MRPAIAAGLFSAGAAATILLVAAWAFGAGPIEIPDPEITPGQIASSDVHEVCAIVDGQTYSQRHRLSQTPETKRLVLARYGVGWDQRAAAEDDHLVPLCLGGADTVQNRWPQPRAGTIWVAADKDKLEAEACRQVCSGNAPLAIAQGWFLAPADWRNSYCARFPSDSRCPR